jgi:tetratricopeptide (TPR) repeat protein
LESLGDIYHRPIAYQRLGEIAEAEGRVADAIEYYSRLVDLWRDCDPDLVARRNEIQRRRDSLLASRG